MKFEPGREILDPHIFKYGTWRVVIGRDMCPAIPGIQRRLLFNERNKGLTIKTAGRKWKQKTWKTFSWPLSFSPCRTAWALFTQYTWKMEGTEHDAFLSFPE